MTNTSHLDQGASVDIVDKVLALAGALLILAVLVALLRGFEHWGQLSPVIWAHLATVVLALAMAPVQLLRRKGDLVHRVIVRESKYHPALIGRGGTIGLMQIKLGTARGLGYTGTAEGLRDPETNLTYAVKYLAGAFRAANGDHNRAVSYYAGGYYYAAKRQRQPPGLLFAIPRLDELTSANAQVPAP